MNMKRRIKNIKINRKIKYNKNMNKIEQKDNV